MRHASLVLTQGADSAAGRQVLRQLTRRRVVVAVVILAAGLVVAALNWPELVAITALKLRGVRTQATITSQDFKGYGWTELDVSFATLDGLGGEAFTVHEGEVTANTSPTDTKSSTTRSPLAGYCCPAGSRWILPRWKSSGRLVPQPPPAARARSTG